MIDGNVFWLAVGLVFVIEGLFPFVAPEGWRRMFIQILRLNDGQIRFFALCSILGGLVVIWWVAP